MEYLVPRPPWLDWLSPPPPPPPPPPARLAHRPGVTLRSADCWRAHFSSSSSSFSSSQIFLSCCSHFPLLLLLSLDIYHLGPSISRPLMRVRLFNIPYLHNPLPYLKPIWWLLAFPSSSLTPYIIYVGPFLELPFSFQFVQLLCSKYGQQFLVHISLQKVLLQTPPSRDHMMTIG